MKACMREISKWCREVAREPGEEDAEEKDTNAAIKVCFFSLIVSFWLPRKFEKMKKKTKETCVSCRLICLEKMRILRQSGQSPRNIARGSCSWW